MRRLIAVLVILAIGGGYLFWRHRDAQQEPVTQPTPQVTTVDVQGGTFSFPDGVSVVVPAGAVTEPTELSVSAPVALKPADAGPLKGMRASGVRFDVSLKRGDRTGIQPLKPLSFRAPLGSGRYAPANTPNMHPLAYTALEPKGFRLQLASVAQRTLTVSMSHLSPKYIVYVSDAELLKSFDADAAKSSPDDNCAQQLQVGEQKIYFGSHKDNWSLKPNSPLFACLNKGSDGHVRVGVVNRIDYIMPVSVTGKARLEVSTGDAETEVIKGLARGIFKLPQIKAYVGQDEKLVASIAIDDLPVTLELSGDVHTALAEAVWRAMTVFVEVFIGEDSTTTAQVVKALVQTTSVVGCLQQKLADKGEKPDWVLVGRTLTDCSGPILEELAHLVPKLDPLKRAQAIWSMINDGLQSTWRSINGIKLQFSGTMRVRVLATQPLINSFVGKWWVHGLDFVIRKDMTGDVQWSSGSCRPNDYAFCKGHATVKFQPQGNGIKGTFTRVWYVDEETGVTVTGSPYEEAGYRPGQTFVVKRNDEHTLIVSGGSPNDPDGPGNPYLCDEYAARRNNTEKYSICGA